MAASSASLTYVASSAHSTTSHVSTARTPSSTLATLAFSVRVSVIPAHGARSTHPPSSTTEADSLDRITDRTLRHLTQYSPLIPGPQRTHLLSPDNPPALIRQTVNVNLLSEFPLLVSGQLRFDVPVFALWGACEDVQVLEKFRTGQYTIPNLTVLDEATTRAIDVGGVRLRLLGLGGALVSHKLFDNGDGNATIAGAGGTMWTTALQIGELVDTAQRVHDPAETRLLLSHASPGREGLIAQLALALKADLTVSAGLHFRYASSYNEFSVQPDFDGFRRKLAGSKESFHRVWDAVRAQVDSAIDPPQRVLLDKFLAVADRVPSAPSAPGAPGASTLIGEEPAWKNCWHWNLCDAAYGALVLDVRDGRVSAELKSQGFNFAYRRSATAVPNGGPSTSLTPAPDYKPGPPPAKIPTPAPKATTPGPGPAPTSARVTPAPRGHTPAAASVTSVGGTSVANGSSTAPSPAPGQQGGKTEEQRAAEKVEKLKAKKERLKEKKAERKAAADDEAGSRAATPAAAPSDEMTSPSASVGAGTPTHTRPPRNPWTLFFRTAADGGADEGQIRTFFSEDTRGGIIRVNYPPSFAGREKRIAYIEFGDEEAMSKALAAHAEVSPSAVDTEARAHTTSQKIGDVVPEISVAKDRAEREAAGDYRGRGRGRGRGGFAARGFAAAGLTRGGPPGAKPANGSA